MLSQDVLGETVECDSIDHAVPVNLALFYIMEGLIPLLAAFCTKLMYPSLLTPQIIDVLTMFSRNLAVS